MRRITEIAQSEASLLGADANVETLLQAYVVYNNPYISELVLESAKKVSSGIKKMPEKLSSEDFSHCFRKNRAFLFVWEQEIKKGLCYTSAQ